MYGQHYRPRPSGGPRGPAQPPAPPLPQYFPLNPNPYIQNPIPYTQNTNPFLQNPNFQSSQSSHLQNPTFPLQNPNPYLQNPNFSSQVSHLQNPTLPLQQFPNSCFQPQSSTSKPSEARERIDCAVVKAHRNLLAVGESVSAWKVSQSALLFLQVDSWSSLGFQMQEIPSLNRLMVTEGKVNAFIHCFVGVRRITSLYDLKAAICKNEGVECFEELEMGPLLRHPLVVHYFLVPSDATEIAKITSEEMILYLVEFMDTCKDKDIGAEEFLDFIATKKSITPREKLGVRIQSLRMHIISIREARKAEDATLTKFNKELKSTAGNQIRKVKVDIPQISVTHSQKKDFDKRFNAITQRMKSFSSVNKDFRGKHITFVSSSSEHESDDDNSTEDDEDENNLSNQSSISRSGQCNDQRASRCPYPSATEEMTRLGLKAEMDGESFAADESKKSAGRKRKQNVSNSLPQKPPKRGKAKLDESELELPIQESSSKKDLVIEDKVDNHLLPDDAVRMFITTWKEACRELSVSQVLDKMVDFYHSTGRRRKLTKSMISSYPFIGLLNVAIRSVKSGMWDSLYDTFQSISQQRFITADSDQFNDFETEDFGPSEKDAVSGSNHISELVSVNVEDIVRKIASYYELNGAIQREGKTGLEMQIIWLRKLLSCEKWLTEQFSVKEFGSLGHGEFLMFLEKHVALLPNELHESFAGGLSKESSLKVSMLQRQLAVLLSQAASCFWENDSISKQQISVLLKRQFPLISFEITGGEPTEDLLEGMTKQKSSAASSCVVFSVTLSGTCCIGNPLVHSEKQLQETAGMMDDLGWRVGILGPVTAKDAVRCLLKAPFLSDVQSWSHWDLVFAPMLGSLVEWLFTVGDNKDLLCLVTRDGKVLRIDPSATVDGFLESLLKGSSFQTAVKLVSLFAFYGGERHIPSSLLKCYASRAMEVMVKNNVDSPEVKHGGDFFMHGKALEGHHILAEKSTSNPLVVEPPGANLHVMAGSELFDDMSRVNKAVPVASRFIVDCLGYLPSEFRCFAADVLLSALQSVTKDAAIAILRECNNTDQRLMLHDLGLSLGIVQWIEDYHAFCSTAATDLVMSSGTSSLKAVGGAVGTDLKCTPDVSGNLPPYGRNIMVTSETDSQIHDTMDHKVFLEQSSDDCTRLQSKHCEDQDANLIIESIRCEEFGLDPCLTHSEISILKKQHARLGRALHCLSQELYSQDSHFILELVQNADDNMYPKYVEPTLVFILQATGIVVLNNEQGFSAENIKALCDVGNSTKKGSNAGYIGQKGIGFKSVFRVTDAPEIHSNGFHVKFDVSEGQIGFVLPTVVPPCHVDVFSRLLCCETNTTSWNTCIVLPFRSTLIEGMGMGSIISMFSDLHPSLLLFLHRLQCIKFKNMLDDTLIVMRRETIGNGIVKVSHGKENMCWFVATQKLQANVFRSDVQTTEIAIAFTLQESDNGDYKPKLEQQPVFAFLPLRTYGLKFILQGDFVLPSSREEVDGDSAWNQWLLSEFPHLFVSAEMSFCALPCFCESPGKAVAAYMSFVPLDGEVHGFFCHLPRMIISKLRLSNCLLLEGNAKDWVPPCKVLRGWNELAHTILPQTLLQQHLGLGFLDKDITLSNPLAKALGIEDYGAKVLIDIISSICQTDNGIDSLGLNWLSSWINALYTMLVQSSVQTSLNVVVESDLMRRLREIAFIPLSDGTYGSVAKGTIWLPSDAFSNGFEGEHCIDTFGRLYAALRTVRLGLLSAAGVNTYSLEEISVDNIVRMLQTIGVQRLTAHEIIKVHIIPAICDDGIMDRDNNLMTEYLSFVMLHLQSGCLSCRVERENIVSELKNRVFVLTNHHGYKRTTDVSIHFSREFGNPVDMNKLFGASDFNWCEVDIMYLKHPSTISLSSGLTKWRDFLQELGVTDFVQTVQVVKKATDISHSFLMNMLSDGDLISCVSVIEDWESPELVHLLSMLSSHNNLEKCKCLLEVLDDMWDDCFSDKVMGHCMFKTTKESKPFKSSFMNSICDIQWVVSSMNEKLHYPKDIFYDCEAVRSILGACAPYAVPMVRSKKLISDIGFKTQVTLNDALAVLQVWTRAATPFMASISQMSKFYSFIWDEISTSKAKIAGNFSSGPSIFVPFVYPCKQDDIVRGMFLSPEEVHWHDLTGSVNRIEEVLQHGSIVRTNCPISKTLSHLYPNLHDFFVHECGVCETPSFHGYLQILLQLSSVALPSQVANAVFWILLKWADDLKSGLLGPGDVSYLKECLLKLESTVLPTMQDKWVSRHASYGFVCWCDNDELKKQFKHSDHIDFLYFGELSDEEKKMLPAKLAPLMQTIGVPSLSEVVAREAIFYGMEDCREKASLVDWVLPYAQRFIYKLHPERYFEFKQSNFENLSRLQIVVVEKLFYRYTIKGCDSASKKRFECSCLLQANILYVRRDSDPHSIFLEFGRLFFDGAPELHFANFLHMITTMAESGSTEEQREFFILNSQKVPKIPEEEPVWFLSSLQEDETSHLTCTSAMAAEPNPSKSKRKPGINSNWPPADWNNAPDFAFARRAYHFKTKPSVPPNNGSSQEDEPEGIISHTTTNHEILNGVSVDWVTHDVASATTATLLLQDSSVVEGQPYMDSSVPVLKETDSSLEDLNKSSDSVTIPTGQNVGLSTFNERDQLLFGTPNEKQKAITGRQGELVAFMYFAEKFGEAGVEWVNKEAETGLPYDLVIGVNGQPKEYIEVKASKSESKDWFQISTREWQFAVEKEDSFSIVHVALVGLKNPRITIFKNPVKLCKKGVLQLAVLMPKLQGKS
ncbi:protein NO VEIN isoform X2 [Telopea speciosissima]|uniref:protein NO VEIN isoform X2 n=1 Tax=Telopea speciosissima TaxID=54955 RepID=UPI001CC81939|nr:protein NO VEIN isoform X2 [Telopea speciosissima]